MRTPFTGQCAGFSNKWNFEGWREVCGAITPGDTKQVTIVQQPGSFRVIARPPTPQDPQWPDILAEYRL